MDVNLAPPPVAASPPRRIQDARVSAPPLPPTPKEDGASLVDVLSLVLWVGCAAVGTVGLNLAYPQARPAMTPPAPVEAEILQVELTDDATPLADSLPERPDASPPPFLPPDPTTALSPAPPLTAVAEPSARIAFALPVEGPVRIVPIEQASSSRSLEPAPTNAIASPRLQVQPLAFGRGEGRQPAPDYPSAAAREGQEGVVTVRFRVSEGGRVLAAEVSTASAWPLLNEAAVRAVRERWRFQKGSPRLYEVAIRFELNP